MIAPTPRRVIRRISRRDLPPFVAVPRVEANGFSADVSGRAYGAGFWTAYVSNTLASAAWALLFRYADFVTHLGGTELHLGWIVGIGMVGSVVMRFFLGTGIDRHGPRVIWLSSLVVLAAVLFAHLGISDCRGLPIYALRIILCTAIAGAFGASATFIAAGTSVERMAELIGMLGTSGFMGMMLGAQLGDLLCGTQALNRWQIDQLFIVAGLLVVAAIPFTWWATRHQSPVVHRRRQPMLWILRRYQPGTVLLVGIAAGVAITVPPTFLRPYAAELNITRIGVFFGVWAGAAVATRFFSRRLPDRFGLPPIIVFGLAVMAISQFLFLTVTSQWWLAVPGLSLGVAQGIIYPMATAAGASTFPNRHRGLAITLSLATFDIGQLLGAPVLGLILHHAGSFGLSSYPAMFTATAGIVAAAGIVYALFPTRSRTGRHLAQRVIREPAAARRNGHAVSAGLGDPRRTEASGDPGRTQPVKP